MKIESSDQSIADLFNMGYYIIPRFQRPYSWDQENIVEFWDDIVRNRPEQYFIGSMVVYRISDRHFGVVDGQQRLTTITLLLCALRNAFSEEGFVALADGLHSLIERKNIDSVSEFILQTQSSYPYFQDHIQKFGDPELDPDIHTEEKRLAAAYDLFVKLVADMILTIKKSPLVVVDQMPEEVKRVLCEVRDMLLGLKVIRVLLDNEDDAYVIFETLNTRGKDLALADLIKNHFTRLVREKNKGLDQTKEKWNTIRGTIEGSKSDLSTDSFIHHYWMSRYEYTTVKSLFKSFKQKVKKSNATSELNEMCLDAEIYRSIYEVDYGEWSKQESGIANSLIALMLFRVRQQVPCVLSLLRAYRARKVKLGALQAALKCIENFHFQFTAITSQRSSGGISGMYASLGRRIFSAEDSQAAAIVIQELKGKLRERLPSEREFESLFPEVIYTNRLSKQRGLVKYILVELAKAEGQAFSCNWDDLTIEHILSQSEIGSSGASDDIVGQMGNLLLVPSSLNGALKNKPFLEKKKILVTNGYSLCSTLDQSIDWTADRIKIRTKEIALKACREVWKI